MPKNAEEISKTHSSTTKYLILREALKLSENSSPASAEVYETKSVEISKELNQLHLDDILRKNPWDLFNIFNSNKNDKFDNDTIKQELIHMTAQLNYLPTKEKDDLKKLLLDDNFKKELITENNNSDESKQKPIADKIYKIYDYIQKTSENIIQQTLEETTQQNSENIRKFTSSANRIAQSLLKSTSTIENFRDSVDTAFTIASQAIEQNSNYIEVANFISAKVNEIALKSDNEELHALNNLARITYDKDKKQENEERFRDCFNNFNEGNSYQKDIIISNLIFGEFSCSLSKDAQSIKSSEKKQGLLEISSIFVASVANGSIGTNRKELSEDALKENFLKFKTLTRKTLESVKIFDEKTKFNEESKDLQTLIDTGDKSLLRPLVDGATSFAKTTTAFGCGLVESILSLDREQQVETSRKANEDESKPPQRKKTQESFKPFADALISLTTSTTTLASGIFESAISFTQKREDAVEKTPKEETKQLSEEQHRELIPSPNPTTNSHSNKSPTIEAKVLVWC